MRRLGLVKIMMREGMAKIIGRYIVYTTDDEMPDCMGCDHCDDCDGKYVGHISQSKFAELKKKYTEGEK